VLVSFIYYVYDQKRKIVNCESDMG